MQTLMFSASHPITLSQIQSLLPKEYESSIDEKLGGIMTILSVSKDGSKFLELNAIDDDENIETMKDFQGVKGPPEFVKLLQDETLYFMIVSHSDNHIAETNDILQRCVANNVIEFDSTHLDVRQLDASSPIL